MKTLPVSRANDFLLTAEELRLRRAKRRRLIIAGVSVLLVLVLLLLFGRPASHAIKAWQARRHAARAFGLIEEEKWADAQREAVAAYQLFGTEPQAVRAVARFLSRTRQAQALDFWEQLAALQPLTREDLRDQAAVALALNDPAIAEAAVKQLLGKITGGPASADWLLAAQLGLQRGAPNEAAAALQQLFSSSATTRQEQLQGVVLGLRAFGSGSENDQKHQADAWQRIEKLAIGEDETALDSLVLLAQRDLSTPPPTALAQSLNAQLSTSQIAEALDHHPLSKPPQKLLAIDLRIHASPNEKATLIQAAIARWKEADEEALTALARWLNGRGESTRELDTVPLERALQTRDLFLQRLDALGALGRWDEVRGLLEGDRFPLDPMIARMYLARCYALLGQKTASENNWQRALEAARSDAGKLMTLGDYAGKNGAADIADAAYTAAITAAPNLRSAWQGKLRLAQVTRDTKTIHAVLVEMLKLWPNDTAIQNDEAYTRLLLLPSGNAEDRSQKSEVSSSSLTSDLRPPSSEFAQIERLARDLIQRDPASLPHRTLLALVYLKQNRPATALGVYENIHVSTNALTPSALAVHAAVLQANGRVDDAAKEAAQVPRSALLPEESALLGSL